MAGRHRYTRISGKSSEDLVNILQTRISDRDRRRIEREIYDRIVPRVVTMLINRLGVAHADAKEFASHAAEILLRNPDRYDEQKASVLWYIWIIASRRAMSASRKSGRMPDFVALDDVPQSNPVVQRKPERPRAEGEPNASTAPSPAERVLAELPRVEREVLRLHARGIGNPEIARIRGTSTGAVRTALSRAKARFKRIYPAPDDAG